MKIKIKVNPDFPRCPICKINNFSHLKYTLKPFKVYFCGNCSNGYTYPIPSNISKYYHQNYWVSEGALGRIKDFAYSIFQTRRKKIVEKYLKSGEILDVGSGEGSFSKSLQGSFKTTNLDFPGSKIKNPKVIKRNFLNWSTSQRFDAIVFWESLEHVSNPKDYLKKAKTLLRKNGFIFIECPRFESFESRLFGKSWFHLDLPRHLTHLTPTGARKLLQRLGLNVIEYKNIFAPEYVIWGFGASFLSKFSINITDSVKKGNFLLFILLIPLIAISLITEIVFYKIQNTPIMLIIAKKNEI